MAFVVRHQGSRIVRLNSFCQILNYSMNVGWFAFFRPPLGFHVVADKGFNYSHFDGAFVNQKKNHFQVGKKICLRKLFKKLFNDYFIIMIFYYYLYSLRADLSSHRSSRPISTEIRQNTRRRGWFEANFGVSVGFLRR